MVTDVLFKTLTGTFFSPASALCKDVKINKTHVTSLHLTNMKAWPGKRAGRSKIKGLLSTPSCVELASVTTLSQFCSLNILRHHRDLFLIQCYLFNLIIMTLLFQTNQALSYLNLLNLSLAAQNQHKCRKDNINNHFENLYILCK